MNIPREPGRQRIDDYLRAHTPDHCHTCIVEELQLSEREAQQLLVSRRDASRVWARKSCPRCGAEAFCLAWVA